MSHIRDQRKKGPADIQCLTCKWDFLGCRHHKRPHPDQLSQFPSVSPSHVLSIALLQPQEMAGPEESSSSSSECSCPLGSSLLNVYVSISLACSTSQSTSWVFKLSLMEACLRRRISQLAKEQRINLFKIALLTVVFCIHSNLPRHRALCGKSSGKLEWACLSSLGRQRLWGTLTIRLRSWARGGCNFKTVWRAVTMTSGASWVSRLQWKEERKLPKGGGRGEAEEFIASTIYPLIDYKKWSNKVPRHWNLSLATQGLISNVLK